MSPPSAASVIQHTAQPPRRVFDSNSTSYRVAVHTCVLILCEGNSGICRSQTDWGKKVTSSTFKLVLSQQRKKCNF